MDDILFHKYSIYEYKGVIKKILTYNISMIEGKAIPVTGRGGP
jgi:hypothetical protein